MNCESYSQKLDDYLDNRLTSVERAEVDKHLSDCRSCTIEKQRAVNLLVALKGLDSPRPGEDLFEQLVTSTIVSTESQGHRVRPLYALAASILVVVSVAAFFRWETSQNRTLQSIQLAVAQPRDVHILIDAAHEMHDVSIALSLPESVEIAGRPGLSELSWSAKLHAGKNKLTIPLIATQTLPPTATVVATVTHNEKTVLYEIQILTPANGSAYFIRTSDSGKGIASLSAVFDHIFS